MLALADEVSKTMQEFHDGALHIVSEMKEVSQSSDESSESITNIAQANEELSSTYGLIDESLNSIHLGIT